ncbi:diguanylate cyclase [Noviherbaspirillum sp.]|jgi:diguanylate cyclase (GGDEF)-like protein|uniref:sensor domain-containing diguanylate cyclase n=1 Tax=Noviherbaspirillum sp. TaxID=1926288 RepID=UPI0025F5BFE7|nr:diguanylate cyclase [Noviherbaspirillum sp.]
MQSFLQPYRAIVWIAILLLGAVFGTTAAGYFAARTALQHDLADRQLPLIGDHVASVLQAELRRPAAIASMMANDSFVRDWLLNGESDPDSIVRYLADVRQQQGAVTAFLVSERSRKYYYADGTLKGIQENDPQDSWFFRARDAHTPSIVDVDSENINAVTVFVHHRMLDHDGAFLGVTGVGLKAETLGELIEDTQRRFGSRAYFVDAQGTVVLAGSTMRQLHGSLHKAPGISDIAHQLLHKDSKPAWFEYRRDGRRILVSSRFLPALGWHLLVEQDAGAVAAPVRRAFLLNLAIGIGITALTLSLVLLTLRRHRRQLDRMAGSDALTGLLNRQAFDLVFHHARLDAERSGRPLSGILFDIDFLKQINEAHGYQAGDEVLRKVAQLARSTVRESDVLARWGGEEFIVLLKDCALEQAASVAEKLREAIDLHDFSSIVPDRHITISLGVAQHEAQQTGWAFFSRLDEALSKAKGNGRNRLQVAPAINDAAPEPA